MIGEVCRRLHELHPTRPVADRGVVLGIDRDPQAKVTLLLLDRSGALVAVAKVARTEAGEPAVRAEHEALTRLAAASGTGADVPTPLLLERVAGRLVLAATAVPGAPMTVGYYSPGHVADRRRVEQDFRLAGDWLAGFQARAGAGRMSPGAAYEQLVLPSVERFRDLPDLTDPERDILDGLEAGMYSLDQPSLPVAALHGDYAIGNILVTRRRGAGAVGGVVDWERGRAVGLPLLDAVKFAASYSSFLDRAEPPRGDSMRGHPGYSAARRRWPAPRGWPNLTGFLYGFDGEGWYPRLVRAFVDEHAARCGLTREAARLLLTVLVVEQATALANPVYTDGYRALLRALPATPRPGLVRR